VIDHYSGSREPWIPEHGYMLTVTPKRFKELENDQLPTGRCSQGIREIPGGMLRKWMLCFIGTRRGQIAYVSRSVVRYSAESGKERLDIWNLEALPAPVAISTIKKKLKGKQAWRARKALDGGHISASAFEAIMDALRDTDQNAFAVANSLVDRTPASLDPMPTRGRTNWAYQRDAVVTSLEIAGIPKDHLHIAPQVTDDSAEGARSIFDSEEHVTTIEDLAILQDLDAGGEGWEYIKRQRYPAKLFVYNETKLTVILANKLSIEHQLGVDLVYVNETLKAVVFVQYKMFRGVDGEDGYRPEKNLANEINRMDALAAALAKAGHDESCNGYRFGSDPFFMKFCKKLLTHEDSGHVPGMYVPLSFWKRLINSPAARGRNNGSVVYPETFQRRYFTPTHFIDMVGRGWIGTTGLQTEMIVPYLKTAIEGKKTVVLAVQSSVPLPDKDGNELKRSPRLRKVMYPGNKKGVR
jgi:hypothetical protein